MFNPLSVGSCVLKGLSLVGLFFTIKKGCRWLEIQTFERMSQNIIKEDAKDNERAGKYGMFLYGNAKFLEQQRLAGQQSDHRQWLLSTSTADSNPHYYFRVLNIVGQEVTCKKLDVNGRYPTQGIIQGCEIVLIRLSDVFDNYDVTVVDYGHNTRYESLLEYFRHERLRFRHVKEAWNSARQFVYNKTRKKVSIAKLKKTLLKKQLDNVSVSSLMTHVYGPRMFSINNDVFADYRKDLELKLRGLVDGGDLRFDPKTKHYHISQLASRNG